MEETYLALDPGETTGWAQFNMQGIPEKMGTVKYGPELFSFLYNVKARFFIVEEFQLIDAESARRLKINHYTKKFDKVYTARAIGAIEYRALELQIPVRFQYSSILTVASQAFGLSLTKFKKMQHPVDAILHGAYFAWKELGILPLEGNIELKSPQEEKSHSTVVMNIDGYGDLRKAWKKLNNKL